MNIRFGLVSAVIALGLAGGVATVATAADEATLTLTLKNHKFDPLLPEVPAGKRIKLTATNNDDSPAEIESGDFKLEKVVPPGKTVTVTIGPLKPGTYELYDEYHEDESKTKLTAK